MRATLCLDPAEGREWDLFLAGHPSGTSYHRFAWKRVVEKSFGHRSYYVAARDRAGTVKGILPLVHMKSRLFGNFLVSLPFFNYGGLLTTGEEATCVLLAEAERLLRETGAEYVELRHLDLDGRDDLPSKRHKVSMVLPLAGSGEEQWKILDAKVRNQVRKATKSGLETVTGGLSLLDGFYDVFCRNMRDLGTPVYGRDFFHHILEAFPESIRIISVNLGGRTVASGIVSRFRETVEVPWASSIREFRELCPNNLLYWEAIRFAIDSGASRFDFGRSTPDEGTFRFKKQWGAQPVGLCWQYLLSQGTEMPELNPNNPKYGRMIGIWKKLPVKLTRSIGPHIVRNIP